jgi:hypothetical protein
LKQCDVLIFSQALEIIDFSSVLQLLAKSDEPGVIQRRRCVRQVIDHPLGKMQKLVSKNIHLLLCNTGLLQGRTIHVQARQVDVHPANQIGIRCSLEVMPGVTGLFQLLQSAGIVQHIVEQSPATWIPGNDGGSQQDSGAQLAQRQCNCDQASASQVCRNSQYKSRTLCCIQHGRINPTIRCNILSSVI